MPTINFDFRVRGAEQVRRVLRSTADEAARITGRSGQAATQEQAATQATLRAAAAKKKAAVDAAREVQKIEQQTTAVVVAESNKRVSSETEGYKQRVKSALAYQRDAIRAEQAVTRAQEREQRQRAAAEQRANRSMANRANAAGQAVTNAVVSGAQTSHGQIQDARARRAANETNLNSALLQLVPSGASEVEIAAMRGVVQRYARENRLDMGNVVATLGGAQSRFNALGAATPGARMAALRQTLNDVSFASVIDPNDTSGLVQFSAMLRQQGVSDQMRSQILRNTTGISFSGSVETQQAIDQGLPAMLRSLSTTLATSGPNANNDEIIRNAIADFMAQVQTSAATGGRVGVSGNRMNTLRTVLNNSTLQNRLGNALSQRRMTREQRALFERSFTRGRDGSYQMAEALRNSPSEAAAMFGGLFNNDPVALANFLGPGGGGGRRQLINRPEVGLLSSYFANTVDGQGRTIRQYEAVNTLKQQTITEQQFETMRRVREAEDARRLQDDANKRDESLTRPGAVSSFSNDVASWIAENPILAAIAGPGVATALGRGGGYLAGGAARLFAAIAPGAAAGTSAATVGAASGGAIAATVGTGLLAGGVAGEGLNRAIAPRNADGTRRDSESIFTTETWRHMGAVLAEVFASNPPVVQISPQLAAHLAGVQATGSESPAPESRANR